MKTRCQEPAQLGTPEATPSTHRLERGVGIGCRINVEMMLLVMGLPPARPHLASRSGHDRAEPPHQARCLVAAVGDQTVIDGRGGEHAHQIEPQGPDCCAKPKTGGQKQETAQVGRDDQYGTDAVKQSTQAKRALVAGADLLQNRCLSIHEA